MDYAVTVVCDRCHQSVKAWLCDNATSGVYYLSLTADHSHPWASFFRADETLVCDECMWTDPEDRRECMGARRGRSVTRASG